MRKRAVWIALGGCVVIFGIVTMRIQDVPSQVEKEAARFHEAPIFSLKDTEGKLRNIAEFAGNVIVLHFWATWCAPCVEEIPEILEFAKKFESKSFRLVTISLDSDWTTAHRVYPKVVPNTVVSLIDPDQTIPQLFGSFEFPETYVISKKNNIVAKWIGPQPWGDPNFQKFIDKFIAQSE